MPGTGSSFTASNRFEKQSIGQNDETWGALLNAMIDQIDMALDGLVTVDLAGSGDRTLTAVQGDTDEARGRALRFTGALTGTRSVVVPSAPRWWFVRNDTTGSYTVSMKTSAGAAISIPSGQDVIVLCDGTNIRSFNAQFVRSDAKLIGITSIADANNEGIRLSKSGGGLWTLSVDASDALQASYYDGANWSQKLTLTAAGTLWTPSGGTGGTGAVSMPAATKTAAYTVTTSDAGKLLVCSGTWTLSLPAAATAGNGFTLSITNTGTGLITIDPNGSDVIDEAATNAVYGHQGVLLVCDGAAWHTIGRSAGTSAMLFSAAAKSTYTALSNGDKTATIDASTGNALQSARSNNPIPAGKYYYEVLFGTNVGGGAYGSMHGIIDSTAPHYNNAPYYLAPSFSHRSNGHKLSYYANDVSYGDGYTSGNIGGVAIDTTAGKIWFAVNNVWQASGDPVAGTNPAFTGLVTTPNTYYPVVCSGGSQQAFTLRTGRSELTYAPPSGFGTL